MHSDGTGDIPGDSGRRARAPGPLLAGAARLVRLVRARAARVRGARQPGGRRGARRTLAAGGRRKRTRADLVLRLQVRASLPRLGARRAHTPLGAASTRPSRAPPFRRLSGGPGLLYWLLLAYAPPPASILPYDLSCRSNNTCTVPGTVQHRCPRPRYQ